MEGTGINAGFAVHDNYKKENVVGDDICRTC